MILFLNQQFNKRGKRKNAITEKEKNKRKEEKKETMRKKEALKLVRNKCS